MILPDTSVWIDYFNGVDNYQTNILDSCLGNNIIIVGDLIITELLQGFKNQKDFNQAKSLLENLEYRDLVGKSISIKSAENFRILRAKGITIRKTIDVIIATFCVENNIQLIHNDRDFEPMEMYLGLRVKK